MRSRINRTIVLAVGTFVFITGCVSIGGIVSGGYSNTSAAIAIGIIGASCMGIGLAIGNGWK